jgi:hypothetical protein
MDSAQVMVEPWRLEGERSTLFGIRHGGAEAVKVDGMSDGTVDQLFLALRIAAVEDSIEHGVCVPFLADDLFINFDDERAAVGLEILAELARKTQVLFFTHHDHLTKIAERAWLLLRRATFLQPVGAPRCRLCSSGYWWSGATSSP